MKLGKFPIIKGDSKRIKSLKKKLKHIEKSIFSCSQYGFSISKLINSRSWYISQIKLVNKT